MKQDEFVYVECHLLIHMRSTQIKFRHHRLVIHKTISITYEYKDVYPLHKWDYHIINPTLYSKCISFISGRNKYDLCLTYP